MPTASRVPSSYADEWLTGRWITPEEKGAVGDGVADDQPGLALALAASRVVRLTAGRTYLLGAPLVLPSDCTLIGYGATLKQAAGTNLGGLISISAVSRVRVLGVKIDGNEANNLVDMAGIFITNSGATDPTDILIQDCELTKCGNAIEGYRVQRLRVIDCYIHDTGTANHNGGGVAVGGRNITDLARDIVVKGCTIANFSEIAIGPTWCDRVTVEGNHVLGTNGAARVGSSDAAFSCNGSSNVRVVGNLFDFCSQGGLYVRDLDNGASDCRPSTNVDIIGNTITRMYSGPALTIRGNLVSAVPYITRGVTVGLNTFDRNQAAAVQINGAVEDCIVAQNTFTNNCEGGAAGLTDCHILAQNPSPVLVPNKRVQVADNVFFSDNGKIGIDVRFGDAANNDSHRIGINSHQGAVSQAILLFGTNYRIIPSILSTAVAWDPGSLADGATSPPLNVTLTGVAKGWLVKAAMNTLDGGWEIDAIAHAANTVQVKITNRTGGVVDLGSGTLRVAALDFLQ